MQIEKKPYQDDDVLLEGYVAYLPSAEKKPVVLVVHDWAGRNEFACNKAKQLAELGYIGFAVDMYGQARTVETVEEKMTLMKPLKENRKKLLQRITAAYDFAKTLENADTSKMAAIGFCFGGLCVLDLVRSGADIKGVVSFHGLLIPPDNHQPQPITAKILALHGYEDPMVPPNQVIAFADEMTKAKADWQCMMYGDTKHAFMNPNANDLALGTIYNKKTEHRAWREMQDFLTDLIGTE